MLNLSKSISGKLGSKILLLVFAGFNSFAETAAVNSELNARPYDQSIVSMKSADILPETMVRADNTQFIGQSLARRIFERYEKESQAHPNQIPFSFYQNSQIQLAFSASIIKSIQKYGFLNQHQIPSTTGFYNPKMRAELEDNIADLQLENSYTQDRSSPLQLLRPKYAYLALKEPLRNFKPEVNSRHGNVFAVLKDEVKARSTLSPMDSFYLEQLPSEALNHIRATFYSHSVSPDFIKYAVHKGYWEVQIWGALTFHDVDYFLVNCGTETLTKDELKIILAAADSEKPKIPVFSCGMNYPGGALKPGWEIHPF